MNKNLLKDKAKHNLINSPFTGMDIDSNKALCPMPGTADETGKEKQQSAFKGYSSCYYYGCDDVTNIQDDKCNIVFGKCKGLCDFKNAPGFNGWECISCRGVEKCIDYSKGYGFGYDSVAHKNECNNDLCNLGCQWDENKKECVSR